MTNEELLKATYNYCVIMGIDAEKDIQIELKDFIFGKDVIKHKDPFYITKQFHVVKKEIILSHIFLTESINEALKLNYMISTQLEIATHSYCSKMGIDCNKTIFIQPTLDGKHYEKQFDVVLRTVRSQWAVMQAIEFAMNPPKEDL